MGVGDSSRPQTYNKTPITKNKYSFRKREYFPALFQGRTAVCHGSGHTFDDFYEAHKSVPWQGTVPNPEFQNGTKELERRC